MTQQDYEQKKKKCWLQFCREKGIDKEVNISIYEAFDSIFDRAYSLGKQEKKAKSMQLSDVKQKIDAWMDSHTEEEVYECLKKYGAVEDVDTVIQGWVARDEDGHLFMYCTKPERDEALQVWMGRYADFDLRNALFPDLTWDSEPEEVEIILKRKKK